MVHTVVDRIVFNGDNLRYAENLLTHLEQDLSDVSGHISRIDTSADWWSKCHPKLSSGASDARSGLKSIGKAVRTAQQNDKDLASAMGKAIALFENAESSVLALAGGAKSGGEMQQSTGGASANADTSTDSKTTDEDTPWWLKAFGYAKTGYKVYKWGKFIWDSAMDTAEALSEGLTYNAGDVDKIISDMVGDYAGKGGVVKTAVSWIGLVVKAGTNFYGNLEEQAESGGTMSNGRVIAETITETAVDIGIDVAAKAIVGTAVSGAITAVVGTAATVGAGPILVGLAAGAVTAGVVTLVQKGVEAATGKSITEHISDGLLNKAEQKYAGLVSGVQAVGDAAKGIGQAIGNWFAKPSFAF